MEKKRKTKVPSKALGFILKFESNLIKEGKEERSFC